MPAGAETTTDGTHFRVWAPVAKAVRVVFEQGERPVDLSPEENGYFSATATGIAGGVKYKYQLNGEDAYPDPASRYQPDGPHGFSEVIDPVGFQLVRRQMAGRPSGRASHL